MQQPKGREDAISALNAGIEALNAGIEALNAGIEALNAGIEALDRAKEVSNITPAKAVFGSVSVILALIRVSFLLVFCWSIPNRNAPRTL